MTAENRTRLTPCPGSPRGEPRGVFLYGKTHHTKLRPVRSIPTCVGTTAGGLYLGIGRLKNLKEGRGCPTCETAQAVVAFALAAWAGWELWQPYRG